MTMVKVQTLAGMIIVWLGRLRFKTITGVKFLGGESNSYFYLIHLEFTLMNTLQNDSETGFYPVR